MIDIFNMKPLCVTGGCLSGSVVASNSTSFLKQPCQTSTIHNKLFTQRARSELKGKPGDLLQNTTILSH